MKNINWKKQKEVFDKAEILINEDKSNEIIELFKDLFGNDTNYIHAVILTESNPEYSMQSKEFNKILYKFYIDTLINNIHNRFNN